jgi:hypothetical protein
MPRSWTSYITDSASRGSSANADAAVDAEVETSLRRLLGSSLPSGVVASEMSRPNGPAGPSGANPRRLGATTTGVTTQTSSSSAGFGSEIIPFGAPPPLPLSSDVSDVVRIGSSRFVSGKARASKRTPRPLTSVSTAARRRSTLGGPWTTSSGSSSRCSSAPSAIVRSIPTRPPLVCEPTRVRKHRESLRSVTPCSTANRWKPSPTLKTYRRLSVKSNTLGEVSRASEPRPRSWTYAREPTPLEWCG